MLDTGPRVPRPCAKWLTRSSSSIHGTSRSAAGAAGPPATPRAGAGRRLELVDCAHAVEVAGGRVGQALEPPRGGLQVALDVGEPRRAGRGHETRRRRAAELRRDVAARRLTAAAGSGRAGAARRAPRRGSRATCPTTRGRRVGELARDGVAQPPEARRVPRGPAGARDQRVDRRGLRVLEDLAHAAVRRARQRELRVLRPGGRATYRSGDGTVSSSSRRVPAPSPRPAPPASRARARRPWRPRRRAPGTRARRCPAGSSISRGSVPISHARIPVRSTPGCARSARPAGAARPARAARQGRSPRRARAACSSSIRNVMRRCGSRRERFHAERGTRTPRSASSSRASASSSGSLRGLTRRSTSAATSGTGTSGLRSSFGSERMSAVTSSSRSAGHEPLEARPAAARPSAAAGRGR